MNRDAVIVAAARTAVGRAKKGTLRETRADDLAAIVINEVINRAGIDKTEIEDVILGCAMPEGQMGMNLARIASLCAGLPVETSAMTVNRFCASGLEAIAIAAAKINSGSLDIAIAGGAESMSAVPMGGFTPEINLRLVEEFPEAYIPMGLTAENVIERYGITREAQDEFAYNSHMKAVAAIEKGAFKEQIVPVTARVPKGAGWEEVTFDTDECPRPDTTLEGLAKLKPAFKQGGSATAGNSSPMNDGAAAVLIMSREKAEALGLKPLAVFKAYTTVGVNPDEMGVGPKFAIPKLLEKAGLTKDDIDFYEINEAFACQSIYCVSELGLDTSKVNVNGGAIALGHPLGCTGAKLATQIIYALKDSGKKYGVVSMCIGGGMGAAGLFQREA